MGSPVVGQDEIPTATEQEEVVMPMKKGLMAATISKIEVSHESVAEKRSERKPEIQGPEVTIPVTTSVIQDVETESERLIAATNSQPMPKQSARMQPNYLGECGVEEKGIEGCKRK